MYLLHTDTVVYVLKGVDAVVGELEERSEEPMAISVITQGGCCTERGNRRGDSRTWPEFDGSPRCCL